MLRSILAVATGLGQHVGSPVVADGLDVHAGQLCEPGDGERKMDERGSSLAQMLLVSVVATDFTAAFVNRKAYSMFTG